MNIIKDIKGAGKILGIMFGSIFLLALIAHTVFDIYIRLEFRKDMHQLKENGEPLTFHDFAAKTIPDEQNAANIYQEIFPTIDAHSDEWARIKKVNKHYTDSAKWTDEEKVDISSILSEHNKLFDSVHEASLMPYCDFNFSYDEAELDDFSFIRFLTLTHLLSVRSALDKEAGQMDEAMQRIADGFAIAEDIGANGYLIGPMIGITCDRITLNRLNSLLTDKEMSQQSYQKLYDAIKEHRETSVNLVSGFQGDRCAIIKWFRHPTKLTPSLGNRMMRWPLVTFTRFEFLRAFRELNSAVEMAKRPYWEIADKNDGAYSKFLATGAEGNARIIAAELAIAAYIYKCKNGEYPETLNDLVPNIVQELPPDPFTGKDFIYKSRGNGFVVYSPGKNLADDSEEWDKPIDDISWKSGELAGSIFLSKLR